MRESEGPIACSRDVAAHATFSDERQHVGYLCGLVFGLLPGNGAFPGSGALGHALSTPGG
jgi:hypothetical protein